MLFKHALQLFIQLSSNFLFSKQSSINSQRVRQKTWEEKFKPPFKKLIDKHVVQDC